MRTYVSVTVDVDDLVDVVETNPGEYGVRVACGPTAWTLYGDTDSLRSFAAQLLREVGESTPHLAIVQ